MKYFILKYSNRDLLGNNTVLVQIKNEEDQNTVVNLLKVKIYRFKLGYTSLTEKTFSRKQNPFCIGLNLT